jgi:hypothetical protein
MKLKGKKKSTIKMKDSEYGKQLILTLNETMER